MNDSRLVYRQILRDSSISHGAFRLWHCLRDHANASGQCWPGQRLICQEIGCRQHSLRDWTQELIRGGYLKIVGRKAKGTFLYEVLDGQNSAMRKSASLESFSDAQKSSFSDAQKSSFSDAQKSIKSNIREVMPRSKGEAPQKKLSTLDLKDIAETEEKAAEELKRRHYSEHACGGQWDSEICQEQYRKHRRKAKEARDRMSEGL